MVNQEINKGAVTLEEMVAHACFCKLRAICYDKNSSECMRKRNIYAEFMANKHIKNID